MRSSTIAMESLVDGEVHLCDLGWTHIATCQQPGCLSVRTAIRQTFLEMCLSVLPTTPPASEIPRKHSEQIGQQQEQRSSRRALRLGSCRTGYRCLFWWRR